MIEIHPSRAPAPPASTWTTWTSAPHRVFFLPGAVQLVVSLAFMLWEVAGRSLGLVAPPPWVVPPAWAHAWQLVFATFPWFIFGFGMTAVPNWTGVRVERAEWVRAGLPMIAGVVVTTAGFLLSTTVIAIGGLLHVAGWLSGAVAVLRIVRESPNRDPQAIAVATLLFTGVAAESTFLFASVTFHAEVVRIAGLAGLWLFLLPVFLVVSHRLIPFFSSRVLADYAAYRPAFSMPFLAAGCALHFALEATGLAGWTWIADLPMAAWTGWLAWKWGLAGSFRAKLLAMLHVSLMVLAAAFLLHALASLAALAGQPALFGRGPLHLLSIGYFAAMTLGMVSRVSLGHSGRALEADPGTWYGFLAIIGVGVLRALADLSFMPGEARAWLLAIAAVAWVAVLGRWALRFVPIYLVPRPDGRPG